jgi:hypothetical protein
MISVDSCGAATTARPPKSSTDTTHFANRWEKSAMEKIDVTPDMKDA